ncbi:MAG: transposase, partial [Candidatus Heimdallarchaeota archaeon]
MKKHLDEGYLKLFQLSESLKDKSSKLYRRSMMVLLVLYLGYSQSAAAKQLGTTAKTVGKWVHRYLENGKNGLLDAKRSGRPRRIQDKMRDLIVQIAQTDPILITDHLSNWSLQTLQRYLLQVYQNSISISSIHRILKDHGIRFRVVEE